MDNRFIPGLELNRGFHADVVGPLLAKRFPDVRYSAALVGYGSDVLGLDDETSMDHNWGPRLQLFLTPQDHELLGDRVVALLGEELPFEFRGFPTSFTDPRSDGTQSMQPTDHRPLKHLIEVTTLPLYLARHLGLPSVAQPEPRDCAPCTRITSRWISRRKGRTSRIRTSCWARARGLPILDTGHPPPYGGPPGRRVS